MLTVAYSYCIKKMSDYNRKKMYGMQIYTNRKKIPPAKNRRQKALFFLVTGYIVFFPLLIQLVQKIVVGQR